MIAIRFYKVNEVYGCFSNLIEETTDDYYWGCGTNGTGKNVLGKILMEVRLILQSEK